MSRAFNTAGPCQPDIHYTLPPLRRLPELRRLIDGRNSFVLHAPRQSAHPYRVGDHAVRTSGGLGARVALVPGGGARDDVVFMRTCSSDRPVVSGEYDDEREQEGVYLQNRLFVVGPTSGRWARTRPVWNQWGYDVTSIRDDGTIVSFPFPNWASYNSFRAQPAHAGSVEAPAGAVVRVYTWTAALGLLEVDSATLPDAIGPGMSAAAVELDVPVAEWGDWRVLEVVGNGGEACDWVSNREEMDVPDPCGAEE